MRACWAVFDHSISTDEAPTHENCPKGEWSWCKYNVAIARRVAPPPHMPSDDSKWLIPLRLAQYVRPIFVVVSYWLSVSSVPPKTRMSWCGKDAQKPLYL